MSTSQLHAIVFTAVSLIHSNEKLSAFSLVGLMFNFASIFLAVYSLGIKTEYVFEYSRFSNYKMLSLSAKQEFWYAIRKKNDISDYLADAYKIITFFLCVSLLFVFVDLLPLDFFHDHECIVCSLIIILWISYKFVFLSFLIKIVEKLKGKE